jgi:hypothetical protein
VITLLPLFPFLLYLLSSTKAESPEQTFGLFLFPLKSKRNTRIQKDLDAIV